jgi:2-polyprenyl-6-methoxyphenol hydroxylase-like FAD-dependent oxidoreductase
MPTPATPPPPPHSVTDIAIIGGGPAGSTAATLLAELGHRVTLFEKARHPRFHIGESLLPANVALFERLGVASEIRAIGMQKWGAEFISAWDGRHQTFEFADAWDKSQPLAYQVRRSEFDEILIRRAERQGAQVIEGCRVREVASDGPGRGTQLIVEHDDGRTAQWHADWVIDASGRDTFFANKLNAKRRSAKHNSAALFGHFRGARRNLGKTEGNITIYWFDHGWLWFIPLVDGATSVGAVVWPYYMKTRKTGAREFFLQTIALCPPLAERLADATLVSDVEATGNYSYGCDRSHGENYLLIGDAYTFIDPVFSSGVMLAMNSAFAAAETLDVCIRTPRRTARALRRFDRILRHGPKQFSWFIYRVTSPTMRELFLHPRNVLRMKEALLSVLAGDIFGRTPIWASLSAFKAFYYVISLFNLKGSIAALRRRRQNIGAADNQVPAA